MTDAAAVIVTYNSGEAIGPCLHACAGMDTIVVDNASTDGTVKEVKRHPGVRLIENSENRGFAAAANQGIAAVAHEQILLLNPDVELQTSIEPLIEAVRQPGIGIASGKLLDNAGRAQAGFNVRRFPSAWSLAFEVVGMNALWPGNPVNRRYRCFDFDLHRPRDVEQPAGAFVAIRRSLWVELGGFDAGFHPLWFEDVDFCKRARDAGYRAWYVPEVNALHHGAHSIKKLDWACRERYWYASLLRYASKHFHPWAFRGVSAAVVLGSIFRSVWGVATRRSFRPVTVYAEIGRLAALSFIDGTISARPADER